MQQTQEHRAIRQTVRKFVEQELNPHIDAWEAAEIFPAREVFRKLGELGLLGITKPAEFGGLGLDASFSVAFAEELLASMCKLKSGRLARELADGCLQYWGGMGFTWDNPVARAYRDLRLGSIGGGADEVMLGIISKAMGTLPRKPKEK
ncbi:MAG TPA: acyl-CoA dehydrogenase family protein [Archangium sp.]|uniref:acyl-CoA dehydrogenase family protein n=1 Tax=Archangium sp. TaxID=1872627 RepID=UPI002E36EA29|nr:acyl-CoA dehydrogenase family protein [Archangium sp.]HEX5752453.1 acyl-CoA dehydrogenase family protein [Archangium sp.]